MKIVAEGYDAAKRDCILAGDKEMQRLAITDNNPPFPPDFEITRWTYKGADDGEADRLRCHSRAWVNIVPIVSGKVDAVL
jgi:hypothetical protein